MREGRDRGGIRRGDRADTGDLEARPKDGVGTGGSGVRGGAGGSSGQLTGNSTADLGGNGDLEDLTVRDAEDPELGLTAVGQTPADDWAADTGPTRTGEGASQGVDRRLADDQRSPGGRKIDFEKSERQ